MAKKDSNFNPVGKSRGIRRPGGGVADWTSANGTTVIRAIATAASAGGALRFGYTPDGGAYAVGIYGDGAPYTEYIKPSEDMEEFLEQVIQLFETIADDLKRAQKPE